MKKLTAILMAILVCLSLTACGEPKITETAATEQEKQTVIDAAIKFVDSDVFINGQKIYADNSGKETELPVFTKAYTLKCDDVEGYSVDLVLCCVDVWLANDNIAWNKIEFIIDNKTGEMYDGMTYMERKNNFTGTINSYEDVMVMFLNSGILYEEKNSGNFWSEQEICTRFTKDDMKEITLAVTEHINNK